MTAPLSNENVGPIEVSQSMALAVILAQHRHLPFFVGHGFVRPNSCTCGAEFEQGPYMTSGEAEHNAHLVELIEQIIDARVAQVESRTLAVLTAAHEAADELDEWDRYPSPALGGCSPGGVVRGNVHEAYGLPMDGGHECPACGPCVTPIRGDKTQER